MSEPLWHLVRDDLHEARNTVRGFLTYKGDETVVLQTVENWARRIPPGDYECVRDFWYGGDVATWEIIWPHDLDGDGQPDRDRLLFHWANAVRNRGGELILLGCVAPGLGRVEDMWETAYPGTELPPAARNLPGVSSSRKAFAEFERVTDPGTERFVLRVTELDTL